MMTNYYMPTRVVTGKGCIVANSKLLKTYGKKAMIVTGRSSAKMNGSYHDVLEALTSEGIDHCLYDKVMSNPTVACAYDGAAFAKEQEADFVIAIGGGSPIDAAKAMALLAKQDIDEAELFAGDYSEDVLPLIAIPTTAGTGSEATQYSILTNDRLETKSGLATPLIFPQIAFLDASYMMSLSVSITVNTTIDALSHAVEGLLSVRSNDISEGLALKSIAMIMKSIPLLQEAQESGDVQCMSYETRETLLVASMLAGMVIAQTGTTAVHAMGYSLTYFKDIDHGRANGLLLGHYLRKVAEKNQEVTKKIMDAMGIESVELLIQMMDRLFGDKESLTMTDIDLFCSKAIVTGNIRNCIVTPTEEDINEVYRLAFDV